MAWRSQRGNYGLGNTVLTEEAASESQKLSEKYGINTCTKVGEVPWYSHFSYPVPICAKHISTMEDHLSLTRSHLDALAAIENRPAKSSAHAPCLKEQISRVQRGRGYSNIRNQLCFRIMPPHHSCSYRRLRLVFDCHHRLIIITSSSSNHVSK